MMLVPPGWRRLSAGAPAISHRNALPPNWSRGRPSRCCWNALQAPGCWCWEPPVPQASHLASLAPSRARAYGTRRVLSSSRRAVTADGRPGAVLEQYFGNLVGPAVYAAVTGYATLPANPYSGG
jgi:hypothetical protein